MKKIIHQRQPCQKSCASACVAMLLGEPVKQVKAAFHKGYFDDRLTVAGYLRERGMFARDILASQRKFESGKIYVLAVPSLNTVGGTHYIIADARDVLEVLDPQKGNKGRKYYTYDENCGKATSAITVGMENGIEAGEWISTATEWEDQGDWVWRKKLETLSGSVSGPVRKTEFEYYPDGTGNLHKKNYWLLYPGEDERWLSEEFFYENEGYYAYGIIVKQKDPKGYESTIEYDDTFTYGVKATN